MSKKTIKEMDNRKVEAWIEDHLVEDQELCYRMIEQGMKRTYDRFNVDFLYKEFALAFYSIVFDTIVENLVNKKENNSSYSINIANRFEIGYTDCEDEDAEKIGSFVPAMYDLDHKKDCCSTDDYEESTIERCTRWNSENITECIGFLNTVAKDALKNLHEIADIELGKSEIVIACFSVMHETMIDFLKEWFNNEWYDEKDTDTYIKRINFASNYDIYLRMDKERNVVVEYKPTIGMKLATKNDGIASAKYE